MPLASSFRACALAHLHRRNRPSSGRIEPSRFHVLREPEESRKAALPGTPVRLTARPRAHIVIGKGPGVSPPGGGVLNNHIRNIRTSGTILPSSSFLVDRLVRGIDFERTRVIVELGVGTGCVTREILRRMHPDARLVSLDINPTFVAEGRRIPHPHLTVRLACATALPQVLEEEGIDAVDAVVSSLPFSIMEDGVVDRILDAARDSLGPGGKFLQYQYSLSQRHRLTRRFNDVAVGLTLLNVPPAFVYECSQRGGGLARPVTVRPGVASWYAAALAVTALVVRAFQDI